MNPYEILGLRKWASIREIKKAYFNLVRKFSPELHPERFMEIRKAYDCLRTAKERAKVDIMVFNEVPGNIGFKDVENHTESVVKLNKAIKDLEAKGDDPPVRAQYLDLLRRRSLLYVSKNYWHEAIADWRRILELDEEDREARRNLVQGYARLAFSYAQNQLYPKAIESWKIVLQYNPSCLEALHNIAIAATRTANAALEKEYWERTLDRWGMMLDKKPNDEYLKNLIVETHNRFEGRFIGRKRTTGSAPPVTPAKPAPKAAPKAPRAMPENHNGPSHKPVRQAPVHQEALSKIEGFSENRKLGMACMSNGNWPQAVAAFEKCLSKRPDDVEILNHIGWAYLSCNSSTKAFSAWNRAAKLDPRNKQIQENLVKGHFQVGRQLRAQGAFAPALVHFKNVQKLMPNRPEVYMEIGNTYAMRRDFPAALEQWETVLKLDPENKEAKDAVRKAKAQMRPA